ncbi:MAG: MoaD/ThiS family protein [Candidatus Woesearchaeota archaeon]
MPNPKLVKVGKLGESVQEYSLTNGETVADLLAMAGIELENEELQRNGQRVELDTVLENGDIVMVVPKVAGAL